MTRRRALARVGIVVGFVLALSGVPAGLGGPPARAQELGGFGGYQLAASGMGLSVAPYLPAVLPADEPAEVTLALATATLSSGGTGYGQASSVFPGTLLANLRPLLETGAGIEVPIPDYPLVVESRAHEDAQASRVPGMTMSSNVNPGEAVVTSDLGGFTLPGVLDVGAIRTRSTSTVSDGLVRADTRTEVAGVNLLAGAVQIDSIVTTATATSDGQESTCDGGVRIAGASVAGRSVSIGADGVSLDGESALPLVDLHEIVLSLLEEVGLDIRALGTLDACDGSRGDVSTSGVRVSLPLPELGPIPPGGSLNIVLGSASAIADASPPFTFEPPPPPDPPSDSGDVPPPAPVAPAPSPTSPPIETTAPPAPTTTTDQQAAPVFESTPVDYAFGGVPLGMVVGLLALAVPGANAVRRYLRRVIAMVG